MITEYTNVPTAILLIGYGDQDAKQVDHFQQFANQLAARLEQLVIACPLDRPGNPVLKGIRQGLQQGAVKFVALPLLLSPAEYQATAIADAITWASRRWSFLSFYMSPPLELRQWATILRASVEAHTSNLAQTGVVLVGLQHHTGQAQSEANGDLAKLGWLLKESTDIGNIELASVGEGSSQLDLAIRRGQVTAENRPIITTIVVIPAFLFGGEPFTLLSQQIDQLRQANEIAITLAQPLDQAPSLLDLFIDQIDAALADDSLLPVSWDEVRRQVEASNADHRPQPNGLRQSIPADERQFQALADRINAILPPRYHPQNRNGRAVSAAPMAAAPLQFDEAGQVAWDQMWGLDDPDSPFCELALAGGPPHRGDLLEPVAAAACEAAPGKYAAVLAEMTRGIDLVAGLPTVSAASPGWIGVQCNSEEMAIWLLRAIIVENIMVRREGTILYLPAGPDFTLQGEIKNVVTVVAKTFHYWQEHVMALALRSATRASADSM